MPTIADVEKRILQVAALFPGVKTTLEQPGERLTEGQFMAVIVRGAGATRADVTLGGGMQITRDYVVYLLVARVEGKSKRAHLDALAKAKAVINAFAAHFREHKRLDIPGEMGLVYATEPMRDNGAEIDTYENDSIAMIEYTLPVITHE